MDKNEFVKTLESARDLFANLAKDASTPTAMVGIDRKQSEAAAQTLDDLNEGKIDPSGYDFINAYWQYKMQEAEGMTGVPSENAVVDAAACAHS